MNIFTKLRTSEKQEIERKNLRKQVKKKERKKESKKEKRKKERKKERNVEFPFNSSQSYKALRIIKTTAPKMLIPPLNK